MKTRLLSLTLLLTAAITSLSAQTVRISEQVIAPTNQTAQVVNGRVTDDTQQPVEFANIVLLALPDSSFVQGTVSAIDGTFQLATAGKSNLLLRISCIGYSTVYHKCTGTLNLGNIPLAFDTQLLDEVVIRASLPATKLRGDALVTNIQSGVLARVGSASDVLGKIPGIMQTERNSFEVFGKGAPLIYINGRQLRDASELESLRSEDIKEVELVTNPGARYDSTVKAVIRIKTIKSQGDGFGFDLRSSTYQWDKTDLIEEARFNYRHNGLDLFGSFRYSHIESYRMGLLAQTIYAEETWTQANVINEHKKSRQTLRSEVGANYQISDNHSVGARYTLTSFPTTHARITMLSDINRSGTFYDYINNETDAQENASNAHRVNAYYNGRLGDLEVDLNADYYADSESSSVLINEDSKMYEDRTVSSLGAVKNSLAAAKLIFSYPVLGGGLNLGGEYTHTRRNDDYINPEQYVPTTYSLIKEGNTSAFMEYNRKLGFGQFAAGVRYEHVRFDYLDNGQRVDNQSREYNNWFPNASFSTTLGKVQTQLSYTAKTLRPSYKQLSSNVVYASRFTAETGNPTLRPSTLHDISLSGSWKFLQASVSYQKVIDPVLYWSRPIENNPGAIMLYYENYKQLPMLQAFVSASPTIGIWSPRVSLGFSKQWLTMETVNGTIPLDRPQWTLGCSNSFNFKSGWLLNVDYRLRSKGDSREFYFAGTGHLLGGSIQKSFLKEALNVTLGVSDILYASNPRIFSHSPYLTMQMDNSFATREFYLTVRYRFNSAKDKYKGTGAGSETLRRL